MHQCGKDSGKIWKSVKNILHWLSNGSPNRLFYEGKLISKSQELATAQNKFFLDKIRKIKENLPNPTINPLAKLSTLMSNRLCSFSLNPVHPDIVEEKIDQLKNSASFGLDNIDTAVIKLIKPYILPALTHVINLSLTTKVFPTDWKKSKVIPLFKKGDSLDPKNYRPVAILPIFSKVLERVVFDQIIQYLDDNSLLHPCHHAYRANHNTTTALIQMSDTWLNANEEGKLTGACFLDMSAAFDIVDHGILLEKLQLYGFDSGSLEWVKSYLIDRSQGVCINGSMSPLLPVNSGVPQGSILGPVLYTLFTNELPEVIHNDECTSNRTVKWPPYSLDCMSCGNICCFADDTTFSCSGYNSANLSRQISRNFQAISDFLVSNKLKLNEDKTHLLTLSSKRRQLCDSELFLVTPSSNIASSQSEKLLGGLIHQNLKWAEHVLYGDGSLAKALSSRLNALRLVSNVATFKTRKLIAEGIVMSKLIYLIEVWGGCENYLLKALQVIQNRALRIVTKQGNRTSIRVMLNHCGWLSVSQLVFYHSVVMLHKTRLTGFPKYLYNMYQFDDEPMRKTRLAQLNLVKLRVPQIFKSELTRTGFKWRSIQCYNQLPLSTRSVKDITKFKQMARSWTKEHIPLE